MENNNIYKIVNLENKYLNKVTFYCTAIFYPFCVCECDTDIGVAEKQ